jgi:sulfonate transport system ATP-binding protein
MSVRADAMPISERRASPGGSAHLSVHIDRKEFSVAGSVVLVLRDLCFEVPPGDFLALLGPSGCGKSTLLRLITGLDLSYEGRITLGGADLRSPGPDRGIVFQESRLLPWFTVSRNVAFALPAGTSREEGRRRVDHALETVGLSRFRDAWPAQLSGGMEKRVALARALVNVPDLLLLDEPFSALDNFAKFSLQDELARVHGEEQITTLLVTHDVDEEVYLSDRVAILTPSPGTIHTILPVSLPRPRDRTSEAFERLRTAVLKKVLERP